MQRTTMESDGLEVVSLEETHNFTVIGGECNDSQPSPPFVGAKSITLDPVLVRSSSESVGDDEKIHRNVFDKALEARLEHHLAGLQSSVDNHVVKLQASALVSIPDHSCPPWRLMQGWESESLDNT